MLSCGGFHPPWLSFESVVSPSSERASRDRRLASAIGPGVLAGKGIFFPDWTTSFLPLTISIDEISQFECCESEVEYLCRAMV